MPATVLSISDARLTSMLTQGGVGVLPTDTIYGVVARAADERAVGRLYAIKHREQKPGTVIAANAQQLIDLGVPSENIDAVSHLWPNPISVDLLVGEDLHYLSQGTGHCAFRLVATPALHELLMQTGPLLTSSANHPGGTPALNIEQAQHYFGDAVDFYVDGGDQRGLPSTVARYRDGTFETRRSGPVAIDEQGRILPS